MEDYKKKYEEALERAKDYKGLKAEMEIVFPELKESEDEKIRKSLIKSYTNQHSANFPTVDGFTREQIIAWLEKQGKQKSYTDFSDLRTWKYIVDAVLTEKEGIGQYLDSIFTEEVAKRLQKRFGNIEQNHAWSEEDERIYKVVLEILNSWAKGTIGGSIIPPCTDRYINWLKSLKERYTWKPSKEQMKALNYVINLMASSESPTENDYYYNVFKDMRTHLKKLREE